MFSSYDRIFIKYLIFLSINNINMCKDAVIFSHNYNYYYEKFVL